MSDRRRIAALLPAILALLLGAGGCGGRPTAERWPPLGIVLARACDTDLWTMARDRLFAPLGAFPGPWGSDWSGYQNGHGTLHTKARDMAAFGQLYLDGGQWDGEQIVPAEWIEASW